MALIKLLYLMISMSIVTFIDANPIPELTNITTAIGDDESFLLSEDEIRDNILSTWPADKITTSAELHNFVTQAPPSIESESGQDAMIYLNDTNTFATFSPLNTSLVARQVPQCFAYDEWGSRGAHAWWGPWHAMTSCQSSNAGSSGGYLTYTEGDSVGHSYGGGLSLGDPWSVLSASFSFSMTWEHQVSFSFSCNFAAGDTAQVWGRHRMGWGIITRRTCHSCVGSPTTCGAWGDNGWANGPAASSSPAVQQFGCSTSSLSYLKCS